MAITVNGKKVAGVGPAGLSPYQVAVQGGYTGTEAEFNQALAHMGESSAADVSFAPGDTGMSADNVQDAVTELFTSVSDGKSAVAAAITDKGVATAATDSFAQMAANIRAIETNRLTFEELDVTQVGGAISAFIPIYILVNNFGLIPIVDVNSINSYEVYDVFGNNSVGVSNNSGIIEISDLSDVLQIHYDMGEVSFGNSTFAQSNVTFWGCTNH